MLPPLLWLSIIALNVHLPLSGLKTPLSSAVSYSLGRNVTFAGDITVAPTLVPTLEITDVSVSNPPGWHGRLLHMGRVYLEIDLFSLLSREIVVKQFDAQQVELDLLRSERDVGNWVLQPPEEVRADAKGDEAIALESDGGWFLGLDVQSVAFSEVRVSYRDILRDSNLLFELDQLEGRIRWQEDIQLAGSGYYQQQPWLLSIEGGGLRDLVQRRPGWQLRTEARLSGLDFSWQLSLLEDRLEVSLGLNGPSFATLSPVTGVALPAWGPYELVGTLSLTEDAFALEDFQLKIGASVMKGEMILRQEDDVPSIALNLHSKVLQMADFSLNQDLETEPLTGESAREELAEQAASSSQPVDIEALLAPEVLDKFRLQISLAFDEILSGRDRLGSGYLRARAGGDRVVVDDWHINIPAGEIDMSAEVVSLNPGFQLGLKLHIKNFDYGVLARRVDPESDLKGQFFLDVDLNSETPHLEDAMVHGNGGLDFAVWPEEFRSGIIDLWAVGLLSAALNQFQSDSVVNCVVARFDLESGVMRERALMFDTSKIRVLGDAVIDFPAGTVDVYLKPSAKQRQFISAATPVQLKGSFEEFKPKIKTSEVAFSVVRSGLNVALLGVPLLFQKTLDADGSEDCRRAMVEDFRLERR